MLRKPRKGKQKLTPKLTLSCPRREPWAEKVTPQLALGTWRRQVRIHVVARRSRSRPENEQSPPRRSSLRLWRSSKRTRGGGNGGGGQRARPNKQRAGKEKKKMNKTDQLQSKE